MIMDASPIGPSGLDPVRRKLMSQVYAGFALHVAYHVVAEQAVMDDGDTHEFLRQFLDGFREEFAPHAQQAADSMLGPKLFDANKAIEGVLKGIFRDISELIEKTNWERDDD